MPNASSFIPESAYFLTRYNGKQPDTPQWFQTAIANQPERRHFSSDGTDIELLTWGKIGNPGLLFIHGNRAHADWWSFIAPFFAAEWRCAAFSFSGMGNSPCRVERSTVTDFANEAVHAVSAAELGLGGRPIIIGHSLGGAVGVAAAAAHEVFRGLILVDSPVDFDPERAKRSAPHAKKSYLTHRPFSSLQAGLARFRLSPPQPCLNDFIGDYIARRALVEQDGKWFWRFDPRGIAFGSTLHSDRLAKLHCPTAFIYGDRSGLVTPPVVDAARQLLAPDTPFIAIPDAAHHVPIDQPIALVSVLRALLSLWPVPAR
jgi:pimeloyl-ACP methyl ester carboxylesterase